MTTTSSLSRPSSMGLVFATLSCFLFIGFVDQKSPWLLNNIQLLVGFGFAASFVIAIAVTDRLASTINFVSGNWIIRAAVSGLVAGFVCIPIFYMAYQSRLDIGRLVIVAEVALVGLLVTLFNLPLKRTFQTGISAIFLVVCSVPLFSADSRLELTERLFAKKPPPGNYEIAFSSLYDLKLKSLPLSPQWKFISGGAIGEVDERAILVATGDGEIHKLLVDGNSGEVTRSAEIVYTRFSRDAFEQDVENATRYFRLTDLLVKKQSEAEVEVIVSFHEWDRLNQCVSLVVDVAVLNLANLSTTSVEWKRLFESQPCLPADKMHNTTGGRLAYFQDGLLLSVGETSRAHSALAQDDNASYGKILRIDLNNGQSEVFSKGHRNPQGLLVADDAIWSTEHGPQGGDELNLIVQGGNYGWPLTTFGTEYGMKTWTSGNTPGRHTVGDAPIFAWVPSPGISNLVKVKGTVFANWKDDLLIATLDGKGHGFSLYRMRIVNNTVKVAERINVNTKIRDVIEMQDGRLLLWDGVRFVKIVEQTGHVFSQCIGCHIIRDKTHGIGPDLANVVGNQVASHKNFPYSQALQQFGGRWTYERLDAFLENPSKAVPGTTMLFPGVADPEARKEIIQYIDKLSP